MTKEEALNKLNNLCIQLNTIEPNSFIQINEQVFPVHRIARLYLNYHHTQTYEKVYSIGVETYPTLTHGDC